MPGEHGDSEQAVWHLLQPWLFMPALSLLPMLTLWPGYYSPYVDQETQEISPAAPLRGHGPQLQALGTSCIAATFFKAPDYLRS